MRINKRLKSVANFVLEDSNVIDVGCDHALLCIYLTKNRTNIKCIASDAKEGPLKQARNNIKKYGLDDKIKVKLGDGISTIEDETDVIVISGMGGITMVDILTKYKDRLGNIKQLVLSPNSDFYHVRKSVNKLGFKVDKEEIVKDKDKFYLVISFVKGKKRYSKRQLLYGTNVIKYNKDLKSYYRDLFLTLFNQYYRIPEKNLRQRIPLRIKIRLLTNSLHKMNKKRI